MAGTEERARVLQLFVRELRAASELLSRRAMKKQVLPIRQARVRMKNL